ncbi:hypothetical protein CC78DRAFT_538072 [Lojkania enalia]|uniref:Subtilisin-like serine protease n=1 Tax=Lojkania enalia TaxID=147567 RepID=A0A9P4JW69_9PLEO|nr:hypothetical protein CC78DRAFT_538072 [Didymosphaeria enalia]
MSTFSGANINALHRQRIKGREIIITEEVRLHLVWTHDRIFIKPLPRYLLSQSFWETFLAESGVTSDTSNSSIRKAALGFLRTYRYLIQYESDFNIAQQEDHRLIPDGLTWESFSGFISDIKHIDDFDVSRRYHYGELRLTRLNFYAPFLLRKFHFEQIHGQYASFFSRLYGPLLFVFALISIVLNSMQVELTIEQIVPYHWESFKSAARWFTVLTLIGAAIVSCWFICLWLWLFTDEWVFTIRRRREKQREFAVARRAKKGGDA